MMQQPDPLSALRDIHLPEPVPIWPLAIGWWILLGALAASAVGVWVYVGRRRRSLKTAALHELAIAGERFEASGDIAALATALAELLRRVALARFPRADVASLHGTDWIEFLGKTARKPELVAPAIAEVETALYAPPESRDPGDDDSTNGERWIRAAHSWIGGIA